jgi:hypothetical protein
MITLAYLPSRISDASYHDSKKDYIRLPKKVSALVPSELCTEVDLMQALEPTSSNDRPIL